MTPFLGIVGSAALAVAVSMPSPALGQGKPLDVGKREYDSNCAGCHGREGKGDGPNALLLRAGSAPDLTTLSRRNGGIFPVSRVYEVIDGRAEVRAHGVREMPIWGDDYQSRAAELFGNAPYDSEFFVRSRILALIDYLNRLQRP